MATKKAATKAVVKAAPVGRPTKWKPEYVDLAYKLCLMGATDARLAELLDVNQDTIHEWKKVHPEFSESIRSGREIADAEIATALYHRAKGYTHPEDDIKMFQGQIIVTKTLKHYPPDTAAASLWLRNRQGGSWREKQEVEHSGGLAVEVSEDQAKRIAQEIILSGKPK